MAANKTYKYKLVVKDGSGHVVSQDRYLTKKSANADKARVQKRGLKAEVKPLK